MKHMQFWRADCWSDRSWLAWSLDPNQGPIQNTAPQQQWQMETNRHERNVLQGSASRMANHHRKNIPPTISRALPALKGGLTKHCFPCAWRADKKQALGQLASQRCELVGIPEIVHHLLQLCLYISMSCNVRSIEPKGEVRLAFKMSAHIIGVAHRSELLFYKRSDHTLSIIHNTLRGVQAYFCSTKCIEAQSLRAVNALSSADHSK